MRLSIKRPLRLLGRELVFLRGDALKTLVNEPELVPWTLGIGSEPQFLSPSFSQNEWQERDGKYSPADYAQTGADEKSTFVENAIASRIDGDASILEIGCSSGRHLAHLQRRGWHDLFGIDINRGSLDAMEAKYPELADDAKVAIGPAEEILTSFADDAFDVVFTVETLQQFPPANQDAFEEIARVTGRLLVVVEEEGILPMRIEGLTGAFPVFRRNYGRVFTEYGLEEVQSKEFKIDTARIFEKSRR